MASYMGFFTLIWFTWLQVSLFDVRFATNSVWSRVCKTVAFFSMCAFAFSSPLYDTSNVGSNYIGFRVMCYGLLIQRGMLVLQYGVVLFHIRKYRGATLPIACTMCVVFTSGMIFTGMIFTFHRNQNSHTYIVLLVSPAWSLSPLTSTGMSSALWKLY